MLHPNIGYAVEIVMSRAHSTIWRPMETATATATLIHATFDCVFEYFFFFYSVLWLPNQTAKVKVSIHWMVFDMNFLWRNTHTDREWEKEWKNFLHRYVIYTQAQNGYVHVQADWHWIFACWFLLLALKICPVDLFCLLKPGKMTFFVRVGVRFFLCFACACVYGASWISRICPMHAIYFTFNVHTIFYLYFSLSLSDTHQINLSVAFFLFLLYTERVLNLLKIVPSYLFMVYKNGFEHYRSWGKTSTAIETYDILPLKSLDQKWFRFEFFVSSHCSSICVFRFDFNLIIKHRVFFRLENLDFAINKFF